jgi:hypothetical protein
VKSTGSQLNVSLVITLSEKLSVNIPFCNNTKPVYAAGLRNRPPSACRISFRFVTKLWVKRQQYWIKEDIESFIITEENGTRSAL